MKDDTWSTKTNDLEMAESIIERHLEWNDGSPLGLFEWVMDHEKHKPTIQIAEWVIELSDRFEQCYGIEGGTEITRKVVSFCLTNGQTTH